MIDLTRRRAACIIGAAALLISIGCMLLITDGDSEAASDIYIDLEAKPSLPGEEFSSRYWNMDTVRWGFLPTDIPSDGERDYPTNYSWATLTATNWTYHNGQSISLTMRGIAPTTPGVYTIVADEVLRNIWDDFPQPTRGAKMVLTVSASATYEITFDLNGGTGNVPSMSVPIGESVTLPSTGFSRPGHTFAGWYGILAGVRGGGEAYTPVRDITFVAQWTENPGYKWIVFNANGGIYPGGNLSQSIMSGVTINLPTSGFTKEGSYLSGWRLNNATSGTLYKIGAPYTVSVETIFYAQWSPIPASMEVDAPRTIEVGQLYSYEPNASDLSSTWGAFYFANTLFGSYLNADLPSWMTFDMSSGIKFRGTPTQTGNYVVRLAFDGAPAQVGSMVISWVITVQDPVVTYEVSLDANGGSGDVQISDHGILPNNAIYLPSDTFSRPGHTQVGWLDTVDGTQVMYFLGSTYTVKRNVTLKAHWVANPNIIVLNANGGSGSIDPYIAYSGGMITLPSEGLIRAGYTLEGWYLGSNHSQIYSRGYIYSISSTTTFYAYWIPVGATTVNTILNANGGTGTLSQRVEVGKSIMLPSHGFNLLGSNLAGWGSSAMSGVQHQKGAAYTPASTGSLYAQWDANPLPQYRVTFDANGGSGGINAQIVTQGQPATKPDPGGIAMERHVLTGWRLVGGEDWDFSTIVTSNITLRAVWEQHFTVLVQGSKVSVSLMPGFNHTNTVDFGHTSITKNDSEISYEYESSFSGMITVSSYNDGVTSRSSAMVNVKVTPPLVDCIVTFDLNGGTGNIPPVTVANGHQMSVPDTGSISKPASIFKGWKVKGNGDWVFSTPVTSNITLEAVWEQHFTVEVNGREVTITVMPQYVGTTNVQWGDGSTEFEGSTHIHVYVTDYSGEITVKTDVDGVISTSKMRLEVNTGGSYDWGILAWLVVGVSVLAVIACFRPILLLIAVPIFGFILFKVI